MFVKKWNHFAKVCNSKYSNAHVNEVHTQPEYPDSESDFYIDSIESNIIVDQAFAKLCIGPVPIDFKIDTGSQANILPEKVYDKLGLLGVLQIPKRKLSAYNGSLLHTLGVCRLSCECKQTPKSQDIEFYVVDTKGPPILGLQSCLNLELIKLVYSVDTIVPGISDAKPPVAKQDASLDHCHKAGSHPLDKSSVLKEYPDIFKGIGLFPGECKIHIDPDVIASGSPPSSCPICTT